MPPPEGQASRVTPRRQRPGSRERQWGPSARRGAGYTRLVLGASYPVAAFSLVDAPEVPASPIANATRPAFGGRRLRASSLAMCSV